MDSVFEASTQAINRLDFVSALLAAIALLLGLSAIPIFLLLRDRAAKVAREVAKEELKTFMENLEKTAVSRIESLLLGTMADYMPTMQDEPVSDDVADEIAGAMEVKNDAGDTRDQESPGAGTGRRSGPRPRSGRKGA